jgi:hypothetical protein
MGCICICICNTHVETPWKSSVSVYIGLWNEDHQLLKFGVYVTWDCYYAVEVDDEH